jgi:hypothetical protein
MTRRCWLYLSGLRLRPITHKFQLRTIEGSGKK